jgi:hypothetical protein
MRFVWGVITIIIGMLVMRYNFQITNTFGKVGWAENHLGGGLGGTYVMWKLVGLLLVILGLLYMFNVMGFILDPLTPLFGGVKR